MNMAQYEGASNLGWTRALYVFSVSRALCRVRGEYSTESEGCDSILTTQALNNCGRLQKTVGRWWYYDGGEKSKTSPALQEHYRNFRIMDCKDIKENGRGSYSNQQDKYKMKVAFIINTDKIIIQ
jgi:hypothetical protein